MSVTGGGCRQRMYGSKVSKTSWRVFNKGVKLVKPLLDF